VAALGPIAALGNPAVSEREIQRRDNWPGRESPCARLHQTRSIKRGKATDQLGLNYRNSPLSSGVPLGRLRPGDRMPDLRLEDGSRLFDHLHGSQATEFVTPEGPRLLIRPDGYIAHIGTTHFSEYAGAPTRSIRGTLSHLG
jgi:hypothetical protein